MSEELRARIPVIVEAFLGWGNSGPPRDRKSSYQLWGPGGRWQQPSGHFIEDALEEAGLHEGAKVICVAFNRFTLSERPAELLSERIIEAVRTAIADELSAESERLRAFLGGAE